MEPARKNRQRRTIKALASERCRKPWSTAGEADPSYTCTFPLSIANHFCQGRDLFRAGDDR
jgi:hypothetical protein